MNVDWRLPTPKFFVRIASMEDVKTTKSRKIPLSASELIVILQKKIAEVGDVEITVNTQEGASYSLYSEEDVNVIPWTKPDGTIQKTIEIG